MRKYVILSVALMLGACTDPGKRNIKNEYFDVKGYFEAEAQRLQKLDPLVEKMVEINGSAEQKTLRIADWKKELEIFSSADINKVDWKGLIRVRKNGNSEDYRSDHEKVFVKQLSISRKSNNISAIRILIERKNILYTSSDTLVYMPDSIYTIRKQQDIRLLKARSYGVTGKFR